jgi:hypothetical protein
MLSIKDPTMLARVKGQDAMLINLLKQTDTNNTLTKTISQSQEKFGFDYYRSLQIGANKTRP